MEAKAVCKVCKGTGVYQGIGERDGACVVCNQCKGTGYAVIKYEPFKKRKKHTKCKRVYKSGSGYVITDHDVTTADGKFLPFSKYGITYAEWMEGKEPEHIRFLGCPMLLDRAACYDIKGFMKKCCGLGGHIPSCPHAEQKEKCWERFDNLRQTTTGSANE